MTVEGEGKIETETEVKAEEETTEEGSFPASYVRELRAENAKRRANERRLESELTEEKKRAEEALVTSKLEQMIAERGVVDADAARKLMDMSGVKVELESRKVEGLEEAMEALLTERPYLVGRPVPGKTPGGGTPRASRAKSDETLAGRVQREFARRLPSGMSVPGAGIGNMRIG